jgi:hypothetical protein
MALFVNESIVSHVGLNLPFKIECDALGDEDIRTIADIVTRRFIFGKVHGIPRGGIRLAEALRRFRSPDSKTTLIVDDVLTTAMSMEEARREIGPNSIGVVIFARGKCPAWIYPVFQLGEWAGP